MWEYALWLGFLPRRPVEGRPHRAGGGGGGVGGGGVGAQLQHMLYSSSSYTPTTTPLPPPLLFRFTRPKPILKNFDFFVTNWMYDYI